MGNATNSAGMPTTSWHNLQIWGPQPADLGATTADLGATTADLGATTYISGGGHNLQIWDHNLQIWGPQLQIWGGGTTADLGATTADPGPQPADPGPQPAELQISDQWVWDTTCRSAAIGFGTQPTYLRPVGLGPQLTFKCIRFAGLARFQANRVNLCLIVIPCTEVVRSIPQQNAWTVVSFMSK